MGNDKCWYKSTCNLVDTDECNAYCIRYYKMKELMRMARIPENRQKIIQLNPETIDYSNFMQLNKIKENVSEFVDSGYNLYIFSESCGNGKTSWAVKLIQAYLNTLWAKTEMNPRALFIHVPSYLNLMIESISNDTGEYEALKAIIADVDLVVWDFIPLEPIKTYQRTQLLSQIDQRLFKQLSNIYTGTLNRYKMEDCLGIDLTSRIYESSNVVTLESKIDRRADFDFKAGNK